MRVPETQETWSDTVDASDLDRIEQPGLPVTRADVPPSGFFDTLAEPLIAISAVAVAVYLLFTIRS
jgi:hypothetical protein